MKRYMNKHIDDLIWTENGKKKKTKQKNNLFSDKLFQMDMKKVSKSTGNWNLVKNSHK